MAALPALTRTWYTQGNVPFPSSGSAGEICKSFWFTLKTILCNQNTSGSLSTSTGTRPASSVWSVVSSSIGTGTATATDQWGTTYNSANFVSASSGANHSWCILQNTNLGYQILLDMNSATNTSGRISFTKTSAPFVGVNSTSPAVTSESWIMGSTGDTAGTNVVYLSDVTTGAGAFYMHVTFSTNGDFCVLISRAGQNLFSHFTGLLKLDNASVGDTRGYVSPFSVTVAGRGGGTTGAAANWLASTLSCMRRTASGALMTAGGAGLQTLFGANNYADSGIDGVTSKYIVFPIYHNALVPQINFGGNLPDLYACSQAANCASIPSTTAQQRILAGNTIVPMIDIVPIT